MIGAISKYGSMAISPSTIPTMRGLLTIGKRGRKIWLIYSSI